MLIFVPAAAVHGGSLQRATQLPRACAAQHCGGAQALAIGDLCLQDRGACQSFHGPAEPAILIYETPEELAVLLPADLFALGSITESQHNGGSAWMFA